MLGNGPDPSVPEHPDGVGDCGFAGRQHVRMAKAAAGHEPMPTETAAELVAEYLAYDDGQDVGVQLADVLLAWYRAGRILAFAPVDHTDRVAVDAAMQAFHGAYVGVDLTDDADDLFKQGEPWTIANGEQPDPRGGALHSESARPTGTPWTATSPGVPSSTRPSAGRRSASARPGSLLPRRMRTRPAWTSAASGPTSTPWTAPGAAAQPRPPRSTTTRTSSSRWPATWRPYWTRPAPT